MPPRKPDPTLSAEITMPTGERIRWDAAATDPQLRPLNPSFSTEAGEGFTAASVTLQRPTDRTYSDLALLNRIRLIGATGTVAYDGRAQGIPVGENFTFDAEGWISHGRQRQFTELLLDRDVSQWEGLANQRKAVYAALGAGPFEDGTTGDGTVRLEISRLAQAGAVGRIAGVQYHAPAPIGKIKVTSAGSAGLGASWAGTITTGRDRVLVTNQQSLPLGALNAAINQTMTVTDTATVEATLTLTYGAAFTGDAATWNLILSPVVYGRSGLPTITRTDGLDGFTASDAIRYLAGRYAPKLDVSQITPTTYPIPQGVWREPTDFVEAAKQLNGYHLWKLAVWENARLEFAPFDFTKADWQVRDGVEGVTVETTGDTTADVFNGAAVSYTDFAGVSRRVTPDDASDLRDTSDWIAANQWGDQAWIEIDVTWPCSQADAVLIGEIALAEANRAKRPSTITVPMHIRDIDGGWHPSWEVRANQTISVMNQAVPTPRLITSTDWSDHTLRISTDNTVNSLQAVQDRIGAALAANGITA